MGGRWADITLGAAAWSHVSPMVCASLPGVLGPQQNPRPALVSPLTRIGAGLEVGR